MAARSAQVTVTTAGTAVTGPDIAGSWWYVKGLSTNTGSVFVGNDGSGDVTSSNGFELTTSGGPVMLFASNLQQLVFDAANNGDKACIIAVE